MRTFRTAERILLEVLAMLVLCGGPAFAQEEVDIDLPAAVTFFVTDVASDTAGSSTTTVSFSNASLAAGKKLKISVKADAAVFIASSGAAIPAEQISWTAGNAGSGTGSAGTLDSSTYTEVFQSNANPGSGSVDITWQLSAPGAGILAGNHSLSLRWKLESVTP